MRLINLCVFSLFLLGSCAEIEANFKPVIGNTTTVVVTHQNVSVNNPIIVPIQLKPVNFQVYDLKKLKTLVDSMIAKGQTNVIVYVLDPNNFSNLGYNLAELKRYIDDQRAKSDYLIATIQINDGKPLTLGNPTILPPKTDVNH